MLRPFKSLLNQLRNASKFGLGSPPQSSNSAAATMSYETTSSTTPAKAPFVSYVEEQEDPMNHISTDNIGMNVVDVNTFCGILDDDPELPIEDPLSDPLAVEEFSPDNTVLVNSSGASDAEIMIIDVNTFTKCHNAETFSDAVAESDNEVDDCYQNGKDPLLALDTIVPNEEAEERSDGSDSGLGTDVVPVAPMQTSVEAALETSNPIELEIEDPVSLPSSLGDLVPTRSSLKRRSQNNTLDDNDVPKRSKRSIQFDNVTVFYFPRAQGFSCVPSQGGCSLGMGVQHMHARSFTLAEHAAEQRRAHRQQMHELNPRNNSGNALTASSSTDDSDSEDDPSEHSGSDLDADSNGFLQAVPARQRRVLLKAAGVRKIDVSEKDVCKEIRLSREVCGCDCRGYCDPETCFCSISGIKCQVDRQSFPCGCTHDGCGNVIGRVEFNPTRVRTHYIHTIMRLDLEKKQQTADDIMASTSSSSAMNNQLNCHYGVYNGNSSSNNFNSALVPNLGSSSYNNSFTHNLDNGGANQRALGASDQHSIDLQYAYRDDYASSSTSTAMSSNNQYDCPRLMMENGYSMKMYGNDYQHFSPGSYDFQNTAHNLHYNYHPPPDSNETHSKSVTSRSHETVTKSTAYQSTVTSAMMSVTTCPTSQPSVTLDNTLNCPDFLSSYHSEPSAAPLIGADNDVALSINDNVDEFMHLNSSVANSSNILKNFLQNGGFAAVKDVSSATPDVSCFTKTTSCDENINVDTMETGLRPALCNEVATDGVAESEMRHSLTDSDLSEILKQSITETLPA